MALPVNTSILVLFNCSLDLFDQTNATFILNQIKTKLNEISDLISRKVTLTNVTRNRLFCSEFGHICHFDTEYSNEVHADNIIYKLEKILSQSNIDELRLLLVNKLSDILEMSNIRINIYTNDSVISRSEDF